MARAPGGLVYGHFLMWCVGLLGLWSERKLKRQWKELEAWCGGQLFHSWPLWVVMKDTRVWFEWIFLWMNMRKRYWSLLKVALWVCPPSKYIGAGGQKPEGLCSLLLRKIGGSFQATTPGLLNSNTMNPLQVRSLEKYPSLALSWDTCFGKVCTTCWVVFVGNKTSVAGSVCFCSWITFLHIWEHWQPKRAPVRRLYLLFHQKLPFFFKSSTASKL